MLYFLTKPHIQINDRPNQQTCSQTNEQENSQAKKQIEQITKHSALFTLSAAVGSHDEFPPLHPVLHHEIE